MSSDEGEIYLMREDGDEGWVSPTPAGTAIVEAVASSTDLTADDIEAVDEYVDLADLRTAIEEDESLTFVVEGHEVTIDPSGGIDVAD